MAERRENSVLFSLRELRNIEEDRVKQEEDAEQARIEAERRAREDEIRRAKEDEERKIREEQERIRREQDDRERVAREGELRLKESERRAQIEAAARLEQARIEAEARARMDGKKFPVGAVVGGILGLIVLAGGTMAYLVHNHNEEMARQQTEMRAKADAERKQLMAQQEIEKKRFESTMAELQGQLEKASSDADRNRIRAQMAAASESRSRHSSRSKGDSAKPKPKLKTDTTDPLSGLGL